MKSFELAFFIVTGVMAPGCQAELPDNNTRDASIDTGLSSDGATPDAGAFPVESPRPITRVLVDDVDLAILRARPAEPLPLTLITTNVGAGVDGAPRPCPEFSHVHFDLSENVVTLTAYTRYVEGTCAAVMWDEAVDYALPGLMAGTYLLVAMTFSEDGPIEKPLIVDEGN